MYYLILAKDVADSLPLRAQVRTAHLARLQALRDEGRLLTAGPIPAIDGEDPGEAGFNGSVIIAEFESLEDARAWADADPYKHAGVYDSVEVAPYKKVF
ncbi:MAG: YciI family protein [Arenicellales bacterium]